MILGQLSVAKLTKPLDRKRNSYDPDCNLQGKLVSRHIRGIVLGARIDL
jgi:hypothetical protein